MKMKPAVFLAALLLLPLLAGCASVHVECGPWSVSYMRLGDQELKDITVEMDGDKIKVSLGGQKATGEATAKALEAVATGATKALMGGLLGGVTSVGTGAGQ